MRKLLIVEDEYQVRKALLYMLKKEIDFEALEAGTGERGLTLYKKHRPDLTLSDINMPGRVNGFMLTRAIMRLNPKAKVILMTGNIDNTEQDAIDAGACEMIKKPISDLNRIIKYITGGENEN